MGNLNVNIGAQNTVSLSSSSNVRDSKDTAYSSEAKPQGKLNDSIGNFVAYSPSPSIQQSQKQDRKVLMQSIRAFFGHGNSQISHHSLGSLVGHLRTIHENDQVRGRINDLRSGVGDSFTFEKGDKSLSYQGREDLANRLEAQLENSQS